MCAKFEGNLITRVCFMAVFCKCAKRRERKRKNQENEQLFETYISGMADAQIWYMFFPNMPAPAQQIWSCLVKKPRRYEHVKLCFALHVSILTLRTLS